MITSSGHLEELRQMLLISFLAIFVFSVIAYIFSEQIARFFMIPLFRAQPTPIKLVYTNLTEAFITYLKVSLLVVIGIQLQEETERLVMGSVRIGGSSSEPGS